MLQLDLFYDIKKAILQTVCFPEVPPRVAKPRVDQ